MPDKKKAGLTRIEQRRTRGDFRFGVRLVQHLVLPTFVIDTQCRVLLWNVACERLTDVTAAEVMGTKQHWQAFYDQPRPCLADLVAQGRTGEAGAFYPVHRGSEESPFGYYAEGWCALPRVAKRIYLAIDAGPVYDDRGTLLAVVESMRDLTELKEAQTRLEALVSLDGLTGIVNRRGFDRALATEWERCAREKRHFSLLMADVDHFKLYNDAYGHQWGDDCLRRVANALSCDVLRPSDVVARYGGDEFVMILPGARADDALAVAERLRGTVERLAMPHSAAPLGLVTISVGVASALPGAGAAPAALLAAVDSALYVAKEQGRNRVAAGTAHP